MRTHRILVADPNQAVRLLISMVLDGTSYDLRFASDGEEALGQAIVEPPDLVIAEVRLERLDGFMLCEQLKQDPRTRAAKVLYLTTSTSEWHWRRARRVGADGYITKPFSPRVLLRQVDELLEGKKAEPPSIHQAWDQGGCG